MDNSSEDLLVSDDFYGFIVMDGNGTLFGTSCLGTSHGNIRTVLQKITANLSSDRGSQSESRFSRLHAEEKKHYYVSKVAELAVKHFITDGRVF